MCFGQDALKVLRDTDDRIIYRLNTSIPTASFAGTVNAEEQCKQLYLKVLAGTIFMNHDTCKK